MTITYTGGLNFTTPSPGDTNWSSVQAAKDTKVSGHDHTGGGNGTQIPTAGIADGSITAAKLATDSVTTVKITDNNVTLAKLATQAALTVLGNGTNATAVPTALAAGTDGHILRRSGTAVAFGKILTSMITGTSTNNSATAGDIGEYISSAIAVGSAVGSLSTGVAKTVTSIALTAGDWDVTGMVQYTAVAVTGTIIQAGITTTTNSFTGSTSGDSNFFTPTMPTAACGSSLTIPSVRVSLAAPATYYLVQAITFTVGTPTVYGRISARRVR